MTSFAKKDVHQKIEQKRRLDQVLTERGFATSRARAHRLILEGCVKMNGVILNKPATLIHPDSPLEVQTDPCPYVSRGGLKLKSAMQAFGIMSFKGLNVLDIGASTGGFTDCALKHGAKCVYAIDSGSGQLHPSLQINPHVHLREQANARYLVPEWIDFTSIDVFLIDASFISLKHLLPPVATVLAHGGWGLALIKPQFEAGREELDRRGIVRDQDTHRKVLKQIIQFSLETNWQVEGLCVSWPPGTSGNREFFIKLKKPLSKIEKTVTTPSFETSFFEISSSEIATKQIDIEQVLITAYNGYGFVMNEG